MHRVRGDGPPAYPPRACPSRELPMSVLPSFRAPPVTEVVIGSRFQPSAGYSLVSMGLLAARLGDAGFLTVEERPGYDAPTERFGPGAEVNQISLEFLTGPPPTRYWFLNASGDELLQLQPDWLAANWRKVAPEAAYGRWASRWEAFSRWIDRVEDAVAPETGLDHNQIEVTYVNHIEPAGVWVDHSDAAKVFTFQTNATGSFLGAPEEQRADIKYVMRDDEGRPIGRLHVSTVPGFLRSRSEPVFLMNLTARGRPIGSGREGIRRFAALGHEWIVRAFADLTTDAMHTAWKRDDNDSEEMKR